MQQVNDQMNDIVEMCCKHLPQIAWEVTGLASPGAALGNLRTTNDTGHPLYCLMEHARGNTGYRASLVELVHNNALFHIFSDHVRPVAASVTEAFTVLRCIMAGPAAAFDVVSQALGLERVDQKALIDKIDLVATHIFFDTSRADDFKILEAAKIKGDARTQAIADRIVSDCHWLREQTAEQTGTHAGGQPQARGPAWDLAVEAGDKAKSERRHLDFLTLAATTRPLDQAGYPKLHLCDNERLALRNKMLSDMADAYESLGCKQMATRIRTIFDVVKRAPWMQASGEDHAK